MKKIFLLAAAVLSLTACDNNDNLDASPGIARITASIGESTLSRASGTEWKAGDAIGISSTVGTVVGPYTNLEYITDKGDGEFSGDTKLYYYKPMTLTAYYPFAGTEGTAPGTDGFISAVTDAENQKEDNQPMIDFLWDSKTNQDQKDFSATNPNVNFVFTHKMSKLTFAFVGTKEVINKEEDIYSRGQSKRYSGL